MTKKKKARPPRLALVELGKIADLAGAVEELRANVAELRDKTRELADMRDFLHAELVVVRELVRIGSETAQALERIAVKRSAAAKKANATRKAADELNLGSAGTPELTDVNLGSAGMPERDGETATSEGG